MKKGISLICALLFWSPVSNAEWVEVATSGGGENTFYANWGTLRVSGEQRRVWIRTDMRTPNADLRGADELATLLEVDCVNQRDRALQVTAYRRGAFVESTKTAGEWTYTAPDTISAQILDIICKRSAP